MLPRRLLLFLFRGFHVVEDPVPHYQQAGDYHVGEQSRSEEGSREDEFGVHHPTSGQCCYAVGPGLDPGADCFALV